VSILLLTRAAEAVALGVSPKKSNQQWTPDVIAVAAASASTSACVCRKPRFGNIGDEDRRELAVK
jgi:hypothetical protein